MFHATRSLSHDENRQKVCAVCFQKAKYPITDIVLSRIRRFFLSTYDHSDYQVPCRICSKCRSDLLETDNGKKPPETLPPVRLSHKIQPHTVTTRADPIPCCSCELCQIASQSGKSIPQRRKGRPSLNEETLELTPQPTTICGKCKSHYGKGLRHKCSVTSLRDNIILMVADKNTQGIVASSLLRNSSSSSGSDTPVFWWSKSIKS